MDDILRTAGNCRHYAMCKIDFLGTGVCASGLEKHYASFYPQGRMDLYAALAENRVPVTEKCVEISESCDLCGKCDYQCYFVNEMRPSKVMKALKDRVGSFLGSGGVPVRTEDDEILRGLKRIVGDYWASGDPAVKVAYHRDLCPLVDPKMPDYVVMPGSKEDVSSVIKFLNAHKIRYTVRGNGASSHGLVITGGTIIDLNRMKTVEFDEKNWTVKVGPGVAAFDLQREAAKRGYRVNTAEPAALVCANIMCSGMVSLFSASYGIDADNFTDAEFVSVGGSFFSINDPAAPNMFSFRNSDTAPRAFCISADIKLHPVFDDESGVIVPFEALAPAVEFARECAMRRIGIAVGVLGSEYVSAFLAPTKKAAAAAKHVFEKKLGMPYVVLVIGDSHALRSVSDLGRPVINQKLFRTICLGMPALESAGWTGLLSDVSVGEPFDYLRLEKFSDLAEAALAPSPAEFTRDIDPELRPFFQELYSRPEMTDIVRLNTFRITSSRIGRDKPFAALVVYLPMDYALISEMKNGFAAAAGKHGIKNEFGFITPIDGGKRCIFEYDYYFDNNNPVEVAAVRKASDEACGVIAEYSAKTGAVRWIGHIVNQGCARKENILYG